MAAGPRGEPVSLLRQLGTNSSIYAGTNILQRGAAFLLMPLYTHYLAPSAYGVLAIVTAVNGMLSILFTLGLTSAVTRFYFEYQDRPALLAEFWSTVLAFVAILSAVLAGLLLWVGDVLLRPFIGEVPFWPYVALGVMATFFQPFFTTFLAVLQMRNQAGRYAVVSLANFALTTGLTIALVVFLGWGAQGPLMATLVTSVLFFAVALWMLRADLAPVVRWSHLRVALRYSLPLVPHSISGQVSAFSDRLVLNSMLGTAAAGLYSVGAMVAMVVEVAAQSVNRAYVPLTMAALKRGEQSDLDQIRAIGTMLVAVFCLLGAGLAGFARELLLLLVSAAYAEAARVIPWLVFAGVANAIYLLFVNILFYERSAVGLIPVGTIGGALASLGLSLLLVPHLGLVGAALSAVLAQALATTFVAVLAYRFEPVRWSYVRIGAAFLLSLTTALLLAQVSTGNLVATIALKLAGIGILATVLGLVLWNEPTVAWRAASELLRRRPGAAAATLVNGRAPS